MEGRIGNPSYVILPSAARLISSGGNSGCRAAHALEKVPELRVDVLVAAEDEELNIPNHLQDRAGAAQWLRSDPRPIAIVDAVVPPLDEIFEPFDHLLSRFRARRFFVWIGHGQEISTPDPEQAKHRCGVTDPCVEHQPLEKAPVFPEYIVELLRDCLEAEDILAFHHLTRGHAPAPVRVRVLFQDSADG